MNICLQWASMQLVEFIKKKCSKNLYNCIQLNILQLDQPKAFSLNKRMKIVLKEKSSLNTQILNNDYDYKYLMLENIQGRKCIISIENLNTFQCRLLKAVM